MTTAVGCSISWPGLLPAQASGTRAARSQARHQNRGKTFLGTAEDETEAERLAFLKLEVPVLSDNLDAVGRGNSKDGDKADE